MPKWIILIDLLVIMGIQGCGNSCNIVNKFFDEPACHTLILDASKTVNYVDAACGGAAHSRKVSVNCPPTAGSALQCTSPSQGFPVFLYLVPNDGTGNFTDGDGTVYSNCRDLINAVNNSLVQNLAGFFLSDNSTAGNTLNCTDGGGCVMTLSSSCVSGWDPVNRVISGTANLAAGGNYLACVYIDNSSQPTPPAAISVGNFSLAMTPITITGDLVFDATANWADSF